MKFLIAVVFLPVMAFSQVSYGVGVTASTLGGGIQAGVGVGKYSNIRGGFNAFNYSASLSQDGVNYSGTLKLRSAEVLYDQYFKHMGSFHVSGGALIYNDNSGTANASVPGGQSFTLNSVNYYSSATNPVTGTGTIGFTKAAPMVLFGFGNLLPRNRHFGFNLELGAVFQGSPNPLLSLSGTACITPTTGCVNAGTDPGVQANVKGEQTKLSNDLTPFKYYPILSLGFSYKF